MKKLFSIVTILTLIMPHALYAKVHKDVNVAKVQAMLAELCYKPGIVDGAWGKKTETAVKAFFAKHYRKYDGNFDVKDANFIISYGAIAKAFGSENVKKCLVFYSTRIEDELKNTKIKKIIQNVANKNEADKSKLSNSISKKNKYNNTGVILLSENFENSKKLKVDDRDNNWVIEKENKNSIYCNKVKNKWTDFNFGRQNWSDYSISFKMKFITENGGKVEAHIRKSNRKYYMAEIRQFGSKASIEILNNRSYSDVKLTDWLEVKLIAIGSEINLLINNEPVISASDELLDQGGGMIAVSANSKVCIDELVVRSYEKQRKKSEMIHYFDHKYEIPENTEWQPNDATLSHYYLQTANLRHNLGSMYKVNPSQRPSTFKKALESHKVIDREMAQTTILSYLYYDDGAVVYDALPPKDRFKAKLNNSSYFPSHSMGKSITSYLIGHAICQGYIKSIDEPIHDWPLMESTLYFGQPLINLLNMKAGDSKVMNRKNHSAFAKTGRGIHGNAPLIKAAQNPLELKDTKPIKNPPYWYSNLAADILFNYMMHRVGNDFDNFITDFYKSKIKIENPVYLWMNPTTATVNSLSTKNRIREGAGQYGITATRYDFLRIAKAIMDDWQNDTCEGLYLKEIYKRRVSKNKSYDRWDSSDRRYGKTNFGRQSTRYGGQFHSGIVGLWQRNILALNGYNGQQIIIDMDNSRIVVIGAVKASEYDSYKLGFEPIKYGRIR